MAPGSYPLLFGRFPNYYQLLNIDSTATKKDVHIAYKKAALAAHPDKAGNTPEQNELCAAINNAKAVLMDEVQRRDYDSTLRSTTGSHPSQGPPPTTKVPQQQKPTFTSSSSSFTPTPGSRPDGSGSGSSHARQGPGPRSDSVPRSSSPFTGNTRPSTFGTESNSGPRPSSTFSSNTQPPQPQEFRNCPGFGPERNARWKPEPKSTSNNAYQDYNSASASCPVCDSLWCPGAAHRHHAKLDEIPCNNRGPRGFASKPAFGYGGRVFSHNSLGCTRDTRCRVHPERSDENDRFWKDIKRKGDPNYIEPNCSPSFGNFAPPASAYDRRQHNGTKPDSASWHQARWRCFGLAEEHQNVVDVTFSLCNLAGTTERTGRDFVDACTRVRHRMRGESLERLVACVDLINEVLHFVAAAYRFHALAIDDAAYKRPTAAIPQFMEIRGQLSVIVEVLSTTNIFISCLAEKLCQPHATDISAEILLFGLRSVLVEWDRTILLPETLTQAAHEIMFSRKGCFQNSFRRLAGTTGYPCKPFIFKDRKPGPWSRGAEEPTLRAWEAEQRRREGEIPMQQEGVPNVWINGIGYYVNHNWSWSPAPDLDDW